MLVEVDMAVTLAAWWWRWGRFWHWQQWQKHGSGGRCSSGGGSCHSSTITIHTISNVFTTLCFITIAPNNWLSQKSYLHLNRPLAHRVNMTWSHECRGIHTWPKDNQNTCLLGLGGCNSPRHCPNQTRTVTSGDFHAQMPQKNRGNLNSLKHRLARQVKQRMMKPWESSLCPNITHSISRISKNGYKRLHLFSTIISHLLLLKCEKSWEKGENKPHATLAPHPLPVLSCPSQPSTKKI